MQSSALYEVLLTGKKQREDGHTGLGGNMKLGPPELQPSVLAIKF